jgi:hypothetical protein
MVSRSLRARFACAQPSEWSEPRKDLRAPLAINDLALHSSCSCGSVWPTRPFCSRLQAASWCAGKALTPHELATSAPRGLQEALTDGWPSTAIVTGPLFIWAAALVAFFYHWWAVPLVYVFAIVVAVIAKSTKLSSHALERYLMLLMDHASQRSADYAAKGDSERAEAARQLTSDMQGLLRLYIGTNVPAPSWKQAQSAPFGEPASLL